MRSIRVVAFFIVMLHGGELGAQLEREAYEQSLDWESSEVVARLLEVKRRSVESVDYNLRSPGGELNRECEQLLDILGQQEFSEERLALLRSFEGESIHAKILLIAYDRARRRALYERFVEYYVTKPRSEEALGRYLKRFRLGKSASLVDVSEGLRKREWIFPQVFQPLPVMEADVDEENRLVFEYCIFFPPPPPPFTSADEAWRPLLVAALQELPAFKQKSLILFESEGPMMARRLQIWDSENPSLDRLEIDPAAVTFEVIAMMPSERGLDALESAWKSDSGRKLVESLFGTHLSPENWPEEAAAQPFIEEWLSLIGESTREKEELFSAWLRNEVKNLGQ